MKAEHKSMHQFKAGFVISSSRLTCKVRWDLNRVIGTWNRNDGALLLLLLLAHVVALRMLDVLIRIRLVLILLVTALVLITRLRNILSCRLILPALLLLLLLLLSRLCRTERNLNVRSRYR